MKREAKTEFTQHPKSLNSPFSGKLNNVVDFGACYARRITTVIGDMPLIKDGDGIDFTPSYPGAFRLEPTIRSYQSQQHSSQRLSICLNKSPSMWRGHSDAYARERTLIKQVPLIVTQASMNLPSSATPAAENGYYTCVMSPEGEASRD